MDILGVEAPFRMTDPLRPAGGLLLAAVEAGEHEPVTWTEIDAAPGLRITVATDALKASIPESERPVRLPVSYAETITICRLLRCIPPTVAMSDAIFRAAAARPSPVPLVRNAEEARLMTTVAFALTHHDNVESTPYDSTDLLADVGKDWVLDNAIFVRGAVNYGWRFVGRSGAPRPLQPIGCAHDAAHYDYSQVLRLVQREASLNGATIDLLDYLGRKIHRLLLAPYR
jgi:hypothetical protein